MVDFNYWFEGVVGTCELISSPSVFERVWVFGDTGITSIHYADELFEQLLGDLHLQECLQHFADQLREMGAWEEIGNFASALVDLERIVRSNPALDDPRTLLASQGWSLLQTAARRVVDLPSLASRKRRLSV
jgi:hypothetical protein